MIYDIVFYIQYTTYNSLSLFYIHICIVYIYTFIFTKNNIKYYKFIINNGFNILVKKNVIQYYLKYP